MKKLFKYLIYLFIGLVIALVIAGFVFSGQLEERVKTELNKQVNAKIDFEDLDISFIKSFPNIGITLNNLTIDGVEEFEDQRLANISEFLLNVDLSTIFKTTDPIKINSFVIDKPTIDIIINKSGKANYDIAKPSDSEGQSFDLSLQSYEIIDGVLNYTDYSTGYAITSEEINHSGKGDFTENIFDLDTKTSIGRLVPKINNVRAFSTLTINLDSDIKVNLDQSKYELDDALLSINDLKLKTNGSVLIKENSTALDLVFTTFENDIKSFISLLPNMYKGDFNSAQASGDFKVNGFAKGELSDNSYPNFKIEMNAKDGSFKYPGLSSSISDILANVKIENSSRDLSNLKIDIPNYNFKVDEYFLEGKLNADNLIANPRFDVAMKGNMDLAKLKNAYPLNEFDNVSGQIETDFQLKSNQKDIEQGNFKDLVFEGFLNVDNLIIKNEDALPIEAKSLIAKANPRSLDIDFDGIQYGDTDLTGKFNINDPLNVLSEGLPLEGSISSTSKNLNIDQWISTNTDEQESFDDQNVVLVDIFKRMNFKIDSKADKVKYETYPVEKGSIDGALIDNSLKINSGKAIIKNSDFALSGKLNRLAEYSFYNDTMTGNLQLTSDLVNFEDFAAEDESGELEEFVLVPENINIIIDTKIKKFKYQDIDLIDANGQVAVVPNELQLTDFKGKVIGGTIAMDGLYNTADLSKPKFALKYNMGNMQFDQAFEKISTVKILAPIAKYIEGVFNGNLILEGDLTKELLPDLNTLTGSGYLETLEGKINGFKPLEKIKEVIKFKEAKEWTIKNSKNWFEINDGFVKMEDFNQTWNDIDFKISGSHKINQDMNYTFRAKVPREILNNSTTKLANEGIDKLLGAIKKTGLDLDAKYFLVDIILTGNLLDPKVQIKPIGIDNKDVSLKDAATAAVENKVTEAKDSINTRIEEEKQKAENKAKSEIDSIRTKLENKTEEVKDSLITVAEEKAKEAVDKAKKKFGGVLKNTIDSSFTKEAQDSIFTDLAKKTGIVIGDSTTTQIDSLKSKLDKWNPFKKKKKEN